ETMPRTVDNIGFYSRLGFVPGHLTLTMTADTGRTRPAALSTPAAGAERVQRIAQIGELVTRLAPGYDFHHEIELSLSLGLGDIVTVERDGVLAGFALCHAAPLAEGGGRDEARILKLGAVDLDALDQVLAAASAWAGRMAIRRIAVRCQTAYGAAYRSLVAQ